MGIGFTVLCAMIVDAVPSRMRGLAMGCYNTCVYLGMMLCAVGMEMMIRVYGFRDGFLFVGGIILVALILFGLLHGPGKRGGCGLNRFQILIRRRHKAGGADSEEDQVGLSVVGNPLADPGRDHHPVARADCDRPLATDLRQAGTLKDQIAFMNAVQPVPTGGFPRSDPGASHRNSRIVGRIVHFDDETTFLEVVFVCSHGRLCI